MSDWFSFLQHGDCGEKVN